MIVNGYAFIKKDENISVIVLHDPQRALLLNQLGELLESSMAEIEASIAQEYYRRNLKIQENQPCQSTLTFNI